MRRLSLFIIVLALALPIAAWAQTKPDFSGTWTLDPARSDPPPQGRGGGGGGGMGGAPLTIKMTENELTITTEGRQGPVTMTYKLDGTETRNQVMGRGGPSEAKSKTKWDGSSLVTEETRTINGPNGEVTITTRIVRRLDNNGTEMHVETTAQTPNGEQKRKTVYTKSS